VGDWFSTLGVTDNQPTPPPVKVSTRILLAAVEEALMGRTRTELEIVLPDELGLEWTHDTDPNYATRANPTAAQGPRLVYRQGNYLPWPYRWDT